MLGVWGSTPTPTPTPTLAPTPTPTPTPTPDPDMSTLPKTSPYENTSDDEGRHAFASNDDRVRRRTSRAGTRSVTTLSTAQLERKRANDREAQRAIRQRTKLHIDELERKNAELSRTDERLNTVLQRNAVLESENARLRSQLASTGSMFRSNVEEEENLQAQRTGASLFAASKATKIRIPGCA